MSVRLTINFSLSVIGDDAATVIAVDLAKDPIFLSGSGSGALSPEFDIGKNRPVAVAALSSSPTASASLSGSILTITFNAPPSSTTPSLVTGRFEF